MRTLEEIRADILSLEGMKDYDEVANLVNEALPGQKPRTVGNFVRQLGAFALAMRVVLSHKFTSQIAIGRVTGPYRYDQVATRERHIRPVEWLLPDVPRTTFE